MWWPFSFLPPSSPHSFTQPYELWPGQHLKLTIVFEGRSAPTFESAQAPALRIVTPEARAGLWQQGSRLLWGWRAILTRSEISYSSALAYRWAMWRRPWFCHYLVGGILREETILSDESVEIQAGHLVLMKIKSLLRCLLKRFSRYAL